MCGESNAATLPSRSPQPTRLALVINLPDSTGGQAVTVELGGRTVMCSKQGTRTTKTATGRSSRCTRSALSSLDVPPQNVEVVTAPMLLSTHPAVALVAVLFAVGCIGIYALGAPFLGLNLPKTRSRPFWEREPVAATPTPPPKPRPSGAEAQAAHEAAPAAVKRIFIDRTAEELWGPFANLTDLQANTVIAPYIGKMDDTFGCHQLNWRMDRVLLASTSALTRM
jgi:hypothetical protein